MVRPLNPACRANAHWVAKNPTNALGQTDLADEPSQGDLQFFLALKRLSTEDLRLLRTLIALRDTTYKERIKFLRVRVAGVGAALAAGIALLGVQFTSGPASPVLLYTSALFLGSLALQAIMMHTPEVLRAQLALTDTELANRGFASN